MTTVDIREAQRHSSSWIERVRNGEEIVIAEAGLPLARLVPIGSRSTTRVAGTMRDLIHVEDSFDAPLPSGILEAFEGPSPERR